MMLVLWGLVLHPAPFARSCSSMTPDTSRGLTYPGVIRVWRGDLSRSANQTYQLINCTNFKPGLSPRDQSHTVIWRTVADNWASTWTETRYLPGRCMDCMDGSDGGNYE